MRKIGYIVSVVCLAVLVLSAINYNKKINQHQNVAEAQKTVVMDTVSDESDAKEIILIGDSNTHISYFSESPEKRWSSLIEKELDANVTTFASGGRRTSDFLESGKVEEDQEKWIGESWADTSGDYYIITFGLNDVSYYDEDQFEKYTREMIEKVQAETPGIPILMTNVHVPYPDYFSHNRNLAINRYDDVKRKLATELSIPLIDVNKRFETEWIQNGVWDTRIRTTEVWDDSQDQGKTIASGWFDNIHYNELGNAIVADEVVNFLNDNDFVEIKE